MKKKTETKRKTKKGSKAREAGGKAGEVGGAQKEKKAGSWRKREKE